MIKKLTIIDIKNYLFSLIIPNAIFVLIKILFEFNNFTSR